MTDSHPSSHVAVAITLNAKASSLKINLAACAHLPILRNGKFVMINKRLMYFTWALSFWFWLIMWPRYLKLIHEIWTAELPSLHTGSFKQQFRFYTSQQPSCALSSHRISRIKRLWERSELRCMDVASVSTSRSRDGLETHWGLGLGLGLVSDRLTNASVSESRVSFLVSVSDS